MNTSGIEPLDQRVLVRPDPVQDKIGNILLPDSAKEAEKYATVRGTLIAAGVNAWAEAKADRVFKAPEPGARVMIAKYGGVMLTGDDGAEYRIMNDEDVVAVLRDAA